jgi:hypothetical protein
MCIFVLKFPTSYWRTDEQTVLVAKVPNMDFIIQTHKLYDLMLVHSKPVQQQIWGPYLRILVIQFLAIDCNYSQIPI